ncbi:MAG: MarR family transcriptional regulator [Chthonomonas sp.]|nr:MarR family transcriptional regulator [Chthonomonas sp.]
MSNHRDSFLVNYSPMGDSVLGDVQRRVWGSLLFCHATLTRKFNAELEQRGHLTLELYDVLLALEDAPDQRMTMSELARRVVFSPSGLTRLVDRLERKGFVQRIVHPQDRRSYLCALLPQGEQARKETWPCYAALIQEHFAVHMSPDEAACMRSVLHRTLGNPQNPLL